MKHAFYSAEADAACGHSVYLDRDKSEVKVTCVSSSKNTEYHWPDKQYIGMVRKLVRSNSRLTGATINGKV